MQKKANACKSNLFLFFVCPPFSIWYDELQEQNSKPEIPGNTIIQHQLTAGSGYDDCKLMYTGMPSNIKPVNTSLEWSEPGQKLLLTGTGL